MLGQSYSVSAIVSLLTFHIPNLCAKFETKLPTKLDETVTQSPRAQPRLQSLRYSSITKHGIVELVLLHETLDRVVSTICAGEFCGYAG
jgi:hypothetical protein